MLRPRQAFKLLRLRSGVRRSGLRPLEPPSGKMGGALKKVGRYFQPAAVRGIWKSDVMTSSRRHCDGSACTARTKYALPIVSSE